MITAYGNGGSCVQGIRGYCTVHLSIWESESPHCMFIEGHQRTAQMTVDRVVRRLRAICRPFKDEVPIAVIEGAIGEFVNWSNNE